VAARATDERLAALIERVRASNPFQRQRLDGIDLSGDWELCSVPALTKRELVADQQAHPPFGTNLTYPLDRYTHLHQTSGTTGPPLRVLDTASDWEWWAAGLGRTMTAAGIGAGDRVVLPFSFGPHVQFWAAKDGLARVGAMALGLGGLSSAARLRAMADIEATAIVCTPSYALRLVEVAVEERLEAALESVEKVVCTGEPGASLPSVRSLIEEGFGARCFDHAGLSEVGPFGYPCAEGGGLHVDEDEFVCEVVGADLRPVPQGARGELVLTPLGRDGYPVIRYRTGDVVVATDRRCPAGHPHRWLPEGIVGRTDDMVVIRGMNVYPSAIENSVRQVRGAGEFRITFYSEEPHGMDEVKLEVELPDGLAARRLQDAMREQLGLRVRVVPVATGAIERADGKARRVVDHRSARRRGAV
jgi:phenylacetate-CoA ligase